MNLNTFWKQPAEGFNRDTKGRTEEEICTREEQIGFKFPETYRELMKLQNGGYIRKSAFYRNGECKELLYNGAIIDKISPKPIGYQTMHDVLSEWKDTDEMNSLSPTEHNDLKRLPLISHMDGHEWMCFDYGWTENGIKVEPDVVFFNERFEEYLRIESFDNFVTGLVYYGYESCEYYFGTKTDKSIQSVARLIEDEFSIRFEEKDDNKYGWYNFNKWYSGNLQIQDDFRFQLTLAPNEYLSKTHQFQENPNLNCILGITPIKNKFDVLPNNSKEYSKMMIDYLNTLDEIGFKELLIPEHVNE